VSYTTITQATEDQALTDRIMAAVAKESWANPDYGATGTGQSVRLNGPLAATAYFVWPVAIDTEDEYAYAVEADNPNPGGDPGVISDAVIQSAVQTHWPDPPPEAPEVVPHAS
jgi:hypothetical protein